MSSFGNPGNGYEAWQQGGDVQPKLSILAVVSLVLSLLCITAPLGLICGIAAIFTISASAGRKTGRGLAIAGIIIGLLLSSLIVATLVGANQMAVIYVREVVAPAGTMVEAVEKKDYAAVRAALLPTSAAALTDADIDTFENELRTKAGTFSGTPTSIMELFSLMSQSGQSMNGKQQGRQPSGAMIPAPLPFANGPIMFLLHIDPSSGVGPGKPGSLQNFQVLFNDGTDAWLVDPLKLGFNNAKPVTPPVTPPVAPPGTATPPPTTPGEKSGG